MAEADSRVSAATGEADRRVSAAREALFRAEAEKAAAVGEARSVADGRLVRRGS